jgi:hypothetical protein
MRHEYVRKEDRSGVGAPRAGGVRPPTRNARVALYLSSTQTLGAVNQLQSRSGAEVGPSEVSTR